MLRDFNWLGDGPLDTLSGSGLAVHARVRSTRPPVPARLVLEDDVPAVHLVDGEIGVAPGQACVLYDSDSDGARVLGGGTITAAGARPSANAA